jgi:alpha-beta hydrolase superfamily lysophospholipase
MSEGQIKINAFDGKTIYCLRDLCRSEESKRAVILSHGLTGHPLEYIHMSARNHFLDLGYDVYRISYYNELPNARNLIDCTLEIHARDLTSLVETIGKKYQKIFIAGHSYGGLTLLYAQLDVTALSFWDPAFVPSWHKDVSMVEGCNFPSLGWDGVYKLVGENLLQEAKSITSQMSAERASRIQSPSQVILAEPELGKNKGKNRVDLFNALTCQKELIEVADADHCFTRGNTVQTLLTATSLWFGRF